MYAKRDTHHHLDGFDELLVAVMRRAIADVVQDSDPLLAAEARQFLEICAPTLAEKLRPRLPQIPLKETAQVSAGFLAGNLGGSTKHSLVLNSTLCFKPDAFEFAPLTMRSTFKSFQLARLP